MEESKVRALILEEIQGIINQVSEETKGNYSPMVVAREHQPDHRQKAG